MHKRLFGFIIICAAITIPIFAQNYNCGIIQSHRIEITQSLDKHPDHKALDILQPYMQAVDSVIGKVIGYSDMLMNADRPESLLSNFVADAYVSEANKLGHKVDFGLCNIGGLRSDMPKGEVTTGNVMNISPFLNYFTILGHQIILVPHYGSKTNMHNYHWHVVVNVKSYTTGITLLDKFTTYNDIVHYLNQNPYTHWKWCYHKNNNINLNEYL